MDLSTLPLDIADVTTWLTSFLGISLVAGGIIAVVGARYFPTLWRSIRSVFSRR